MVEAGNHGSGLSYGFRPAGEGAAREAETEGSGGRAEEKKKRPKKDTGKNEGEGSGKQQSRTMQIRLVVAVEGKTELPSDSRVGLQGKEGCDQLKEQASPLSTHGIASFSNVALCQARFRITIRGFETKLATVNLESRDSARIKFQLETNGPLVIE